MVDHKDTVCSVFVQPIVDVCVKRIELLQVFIAVRGIKSIIAGVKRDKSITDIRNHNFGIVG